MNYLYEDLTRQIIGCAMTVHSTLGNGFQELIYQRCLAIELQENGLKFLKEEEMPIYYKGYRVGIRRADFLVENKIILELKAIMHLENAQLAQAMNYLVANNKKVGLLINFGAKSLEFKRVHNNRLNRDFHD